LQNFLWLDASDVGRVIEIIGISGRSDGRSVLMRTKNANSTSHLGRGDVGPFILPSVAWVPAHLSGRRRQHYRARQLAIGRMDAHGAEF
jgi:hypothetical protein